MWFHYTLTVPAGTVEVLPIEKKLDLTHGVIKWIGIPWLPGPNGLVKVRIYRAEYQIFPLNSDEPACGDSSVEGGLEHYELFENPFFLMARGYSPDCLHDHDVTILINVMPMLVAEPWRININNIPKRIPWPE